MAGYARQSSSSIQDGETITAAPLNSEFDAVLAAFAFSGGHNHDGSSTEGSYVSVLADVDALNKIAVDNTNNRHGFFVEVSSAAVEQLRIQDGAIVPVTSNDIDLGTSSLQFKDIHIDGTAYVDTLEVHVGASLSAGVLALPDGTASAPVLTNSSDTNQGLFFSGTDEMSYTAGGTAQVTFADGVIKPVTDNDVDLGTSSLQFKDIHINGTANIDTLAGTTMSGDLAMGSNSITGLATPSADGDAARKVYVDDAISNASNLTQLGGNINVNGSHFFGSSGEDIKFKPVGSASILSTQDNDGEFVALVLRNESDAADTTGIASLRFDLEDSSGNTVDAAKIAVKKEASFTSTAATQDSSMVFSTSLNGTLTEYLKLTSAGILEPIADDTVDIGTATKEIKNIFVDGTAYIDAIGFGTTSVALPTADGTANQILKTDGSGTISWAADAGSSFVLEDDDGTEVTISADKEVKFIGSGVTTNWTDTDNGTDSDPYDLTFTVDAAQTGITSVLNTSLVVGRDADNDIDFATDNTILFRAGAADQIKLIDGALLPVTDADIDLGSGSLQFKDAFIHGTLEADAITINGTTLAVTIEDTAGALFSGNTETGIVATYQAADNTIDLVIDAAQTTITSLLATDIKIGEDDETKIDFEIANEIHLYANNAEQVYVADGIFGPQTDSDVDLGTTGVRWKDAFIDTITTTGALTVGGDLTVNGTTTTVNSTTVTIDDPIFTLGGDSAPGSDDNKDRGIEFRYHTGSAAKVGFFGWDDSAGAFTFVPDASNSSEVFSGTVGNAIFGNITGTLQTAAQTNITSTGALDGGSITSNFGTIDTGASTITTTGLISGGSLDIDNVLINGTTIGHTDDTDLLTLADGALTVAGTIEATGTITGTLATAAQTNITSTGALGGGSIAAGFGAIDNGTSGIRTNTFTAETSVVPDASGGADLGSTSLEWGDLYIADDKKIYLGSDQNFSIEYDEDGNDTTAVVAAGGVSLAPHGTSAGNGTELRFQELAANGAHYVGFKAPDSIAANKVFVLPNADGDDGQFLKTDGSTNLSWGSAGSSLSAVADGAIAVGRAVVVSDAAGKIKEVDIEQITDMEKFYTEATSNGGGRSNRSIFTSTESSHFPTGAAYDLNVNRGGFLWHEGSDFKFSTIVNKTSGITSSILGNHNFVLTRNSGVQVPGDNIGGHLHFDAVNNKLQGAYMTNDSGKKLRSFTITITGGTTNTATIAYGEDFQAAKTGEYQGSTAWSTATVNSLEGSLMAAYIDTDNKGAIHKMEYQSGTSTLAGYGGNRTVFNNAATSYIKLVDDPDTNRMVVFYKDGGNSNYGTSRVFSTADSNNAFETMGAEVVFYSDTFSNNDACYDTVANKIIVAHTHNGDSFLHVATVTGGTTNTCAFATAVQFMGTGIGQNTGDLNHLQLIMNTTLGRVQLLAEAAGKSGRQERSRRIHERPPIVATIKITGTTATVHNFSKLNSEMGFSVRGIMGFYDPDEGGLVAAYKYEGVASGFEDYNQRHDSFTTGTDFSDYNIYAFGVQDDISTAPFTVGVSVSAASDGGAVSYIPLGGVASGTGFIQGSEYYIPYGGGALESSASNINDMHLDASNLQGFQKQYIGRALTTTTLLLKGHERYDNGRAVKI